MNGNNVDSVNFANKAVLIMGSESHGISNILKNHVHEFVTIPKMGNAESLNVSVACGIICKEMTKIHKI